MAFNSHAYHANKYAREAADYIAQARALKARIAAGEAYDWEAGRLPFFVAMARSSARMARNYRRLWQIGRDMRASR